MIRFEALLVFAGMAGTALGAGGVREALRSSIPLSSSDSIVSLTRISTTRLGVETYDTDAGKKHNEWTDVTPETMQRILEAAGIEGLPVRVADAEDVEDSEPASKSASVRTASVAPIRHARPTATAPEPVLHKERRAKDPNSDKNRLTYLLYQSALSTYVYGLAIPLAYGATSPRILIAMPLLTAPVAFGTHLYFSRDLEFTEAHLKGTLYIPTLTVYAATALPLAFSGGNYGNGYRVASLLGAAAYPLGVWYGYHLGDVYRSNPDQLDIKYQFALGYGFLGFVTPTLYYEHPGRHSDDILRLSLAQSVGMAVVGHVVSDYYRSSGVSSGVPLGIFTHAMLGGLAGVEAAALWDASSTRPWLGAAVLGSSLGFTEGVLFFHSSEDNFNRARYGLFGSLGGAMVGTGLELIFYDGAASVHAQKVAWASAIIGGAWLGYGIVYALTPEMTEAAHSGTKVSSPPSPWAFNPLPVLEPVLSRGDMAMRWKIPGFSRHF